jgi:hypothetical protein
VEALAECSKIVSISFFLTCYYLKLKLLSCRKYLRLSIVLGCPKSRNGQLARPVKPAACKIDWKPARVRLYFSDARAIMFSGLAEKNHEHSPHTRSDNRAGISNLIVWTRGFASTRTSDAPDASGHLRLLPALLVSSHQSIQQPLVHLTPTVILHVHRLEGSLDQSPVCRVTCCSCHPPARCCCCCCAWPRAAAGPARALLLLLPPCYVAAAPTSPAQPIATVRMRLLPRLLRFPRTC